MKVSAEEIEQSKNYPSGVSLCNPYNSTIFTNCCGCAITTREKQCPKCQRYVVGWDSENPDRSRWNYAYKGR